VFARTGGLARSGPTADQSRHVSLKMCVSFLLVLPIFCVSFLLHIKSVIQVQAIVFLVHMYELST